MKGYNYSCTRRPIGLRLGAEVVRQRLDVGDFVLEADGKRIVVERKSLFDLAKSLTDGRYAEQKARLVATSEGDGSTVCYLVEGSIRGWNGDLSGGGPAHVRNAQLEAAITMTSVRDNIPVLRCKDAGHTFDTLCYLYGQLKQGTVFTAKPSAVARGYAALVVSKRKRENMEDASTQWCVMLGSVPGMSAAKAQAVATAYPSMKALSNATSRDLAEVRVAARSEEQRPRRKEEQQHPRWQRHHAYPWGWCGSCRPYHPAPTWLQD